MNIPDWFILQAENPKLLSNIDLNKIHFIEQDMWAEWIWEYVKCPCCNTIFSKKDIFWHLKKDIYIETVWKIQQILNINSIKCKKCDSDTDFIWWIKYLEEIKNRYRDEESFLTTMRNDRWEIIWFTDWYISNFDTIYKREFEHYYSDIWVNKIKEMISKIIWLDLPYKLLMHSTTWIEKKYSNLNIFISLLKKFYIELLNKWHNNILWIYESSIWTMAHAIYHIVWAKRINITNNNNICNVYKTSESDIFIHLNIIESFIKELNFPTKIFIKNNSLKIKEVLIR